MCGQSTAVSCGRERLKCDLLTHAQSKIDFAFPMRGIKYEHSKPSDDLTNKTKRAFVHASKIRVAHKHSGAVQKSSDKPKPLYQNYTMHIQLITPCMIV